MTAGQPPARNPATRRYGRYDLTITVQEDARPLTLQEVAELNASLVALVQDFLSARGVQATLDARTKAAPEPGDRVRILPAKDPTDAPPLGAPVGEIRQVLAVDGPNVLVAHDDPPVPGESWWYGAHTLDVIT